MSLTANEQYLLEMMNRARLDPAGEAARYGIDLNAGLAAGSISAGAKQVLAPNALLEAAATKHSLWMLSADVFSHTGQNGSSPWDRIAAEGYSMSTGGENIAWVGTTGTPNLLAQIEDIHRNLFLSAGHRENLMNAAFRELGVGAETGVFTSGRNYNATMVTLDFATTGTARFLTGVAYGDIDGNAFYTPGEGIANVQFLAQGKTAATAAAGGYALGTDGSTPVDVSGSMGAMTFSLKVNMSLGNVKLDLVSGTTFYTSGQIWLGTGVNNLVQLGVANLEAAGNAAVNAMTGNSGANKLYGYGGSDTLIGNEGADSLFGGAGNDILVGGSGNDALRGNVGADSFVFGPGGGIDRALDFLITDQDRLRLDDALWTGQNLTAAQVVDSFAKVTSTAVIFDFGVDELRLVGLTSLSGLAATIDII